MRVINSDLDQVLIIEPEPHIDSRGFFAEIYQARRYRSAGVESDFVQDNISFSQKGVLRGLHYQYPMQQAKLLQVLDGSVFDVALDIRLGSPTFGAWTGVELSSHNHRQIYIPEGFSHGFYVLSQSALIMYKCSYFYSPESEGGVSWDDPDIAIDWPLSGDPLLSGKDASFPRLKDIPRDRLPIFKQKDA